MWGEAMDFGQIEKNEVEFAAVRSRGPGGQNVNKVSSAAVLYWTPASSNYISLDEHNLIRQRLQNMMNAEGQIFIRSDEFRDLPHNKSRCLEKLREALERAFHQPKARKPSKPTRGSKRRKAESKTRRGDTKKNRAKVSF